GRAVRPGLNEYSLPSKTSATDAAMRSSLGSTEVAEPLDCGEAGHEEVLPTGERVEGLDAGDPPGRRARDRVVGALLLQPDQRILLLTTADEVPRVDPFALQELDGVDGARADRDEVEAARLAVLAKFIGSERFAGGRGAPDDAGDVDVGEHGELGVAGVHPPDVRAERHLQALRILRVIEVV